VKSERAPGTIDAADWQGDKLGALPAGFFLKLIAPILSRDPVRLMHVKSLPDRTLDYRTSVRSYPCNKPAQKRRVKVARTRKTSSAPSFSPYRLPAFDRRFARSLFRLKPPAV
jgi:hypothetical protein